MEDVVTEPVDLALAWLHGTGDWQQWRSRPPRERHRSLYDHWCDAGAGARCLLGGVYATPAGLVFYGLQEDRITVGVDGHGNDVNEVTRVVRTVLLTGDDLTTPGAVETVLLACRHGQSTVTTDELRTRTRR